MLMSDCGLISTECARDCGPYEVKNVRRETQTHASKLPWALIFFIPNFSGSNKERKKKKN
jgi:hypothetical protein